jgi:hypothetical protein
METKMQAEPNTEINPELLRQLRFEMTNADWCEGFKAFDAGEHFTMHKGRDWAMGWLSCRLVGAKLLSRYIQ